MHSVIPLAHLSPGAPRLCDVVIWIRTIVNPWTRRGCLCHPRRDIIVGSNGIPIAMHSGIVVVVGSDRDSIESWSDSGWIPISIGSWSEFIWSSMMSNDDGGDAWSIWASARACDTIHSYLLCYRNSFSELLLSIGVHLNQQLKNTTKILDILKTEILNKIIS